MFIGGVYLTFTSINSSVKKSSWSLSAQQAARNGLNLIRDEIQRAAYKSVIRPNGVEISNTDPAYFLHLVPTKVAVTADRVLARWRIGIPEIPGEKPGWSVECEIKLSGGKILYSKKKTDFGDPTDPLFENKTLFADVSSITFDLVPFATQGIRQEGKLLKIWVELRHPDPRNTATTMVIVETSARVEVETKEDL